MNKCILIGNLTRDPELSETSSGISLCRFSIAVNRNYANAKGDRETDFINIVTWRGLAENCSKYLAKGRKVAIFGQIQTRSYDDKDGNKRYATEVVADDVEFLGGSVEASADPKKPAKTGKPQAKQVTLNELKPLEDDGLPF